MGCLHLCHQAIQFRNPFVVIFPVCRNHSDQADRIQRLVRLFILLDVVQIISQILIELHCSIKDRNLCLKEGLHILHSLLSIIQVVFPLQDTLNQGHVILLL